MSDAHDRHEVPPSPPQSPQPGGASTSRRSAVGAGPIILIVLGLVLLASNLGWFSFGEIFRLLSYWPIALVAIGVDMLTNGRYRLAVIAVAIALALVLWGGNVGGRGGWTIGTATMAAETQSVAHPLAGASAGRVVLDLGVGQVRVDGAAPSGTLVSGTIQSGRGETIRQSSQLEGGVLTVRIRSEQERMSGINFGSETRRWEVSLTREVPVALSVSAGVGQTTLDLSGVTLSGITFDGGVGESTVTLPSGHYSGSFDLGVGSTTIRLPQGAAVQVVVNSGLGRVTMPRDLVRDGDVYTSPGFEGARDRITLRVDGGVGSIRVDRR
jgi:hypothetical protein